MAPYEGIREHLDKGKKKNLKTIST